MKDQNEEMARMRGEPGTNEPAEEQAASRVSKTGEAGGGKERGPVAGCAGGRARPAELVLEEPEPWPEPVGGEGLLDELEGLLARYVVLPGNAGPALALWVLHTYAFGLREVSAYVALESPEKRCGKTTLLTVLSELVRRPVVAASISPPALFRVIEELGPTLLIDEADTVLHGNDELRAILNAGYSRKTAYVVRVWSQAGAGEGGAGQRSRLARFSCWCPKALAAIGHLPEALADRCIVIRMERRRAGEETERLRNLRGAELRRKCARFAADHGGEIAGACPAIPPGLNDRAGDIWEPLLALADAAGGKWPERARQAAAGLSASAREDSPSGALLRDILIVFRALKSERLLSRTLVECMEQFSDQPWAEGHRELTEQRLAARLRPYGIRPTMLRIGEEVGRGYGREDFQEAFGRYCSGG